MQGVPERPRDREPAEQKMSFSHAGAQDEIDQKISSSDLENGFVGTAIAKLLGAKVSNVQNSANQDPLWHPPRSPPAASRVLAAFVRSPTTSAAIHHASFDPHVPRVTAVINAQLSMPRP